jgi:hypothetical protein
MRQPSNRRATDAILWFRSPKTILKTVELMSVTISWHADTVGYQKIGRDVVADANDERCDCAGIGNVVNVLRDLGELNSVAPQVGLDRR